MSSGATWRLVLLLILGVGLVAVGHAGADGSPGDDRIVEGHGVDGELAGGTTAVEAGEISPGVEVGSDSPARAGAGVRAAVGTSNGTRGGAPDSLATQQSGQFDLPVTLEGVVTTPPKRYGERAVVGTTQGLYVFHRGTIEAYVETQPVREFELVEPGRFVVLVEDEFFPNILSVNTRTGEVEGSIGHTRDVYDPFMGQVTRQAQAFDVVNVGDVTGDGTNDVAVSAGHSVLGVDGQSGEVLWEADRGTTVWQLEAIGDAVYAGTQDGTLVSFDANDGTVQFTKELVSAFDHEHLGTIPRAVWDLEHLDWGDDDYLAVTTEDGRVALLSADDGSVSWDRQVVEYDAEILTDYYGGDTIDSAQPTTSGDANFFNLELVPIRERKQLGVIVASEENPSGRAIRNEPEELHLLDAASGDEVWTRAGLSLKNAGSVAFSPAVGGGSLLIPRPSASPTQAITVVDAATGEEEDPIEIRSIPRLSHSGVTGNSYITATEGELTLVSEAGDLKVVDANGLAWSIPSMRDIDVLSADVTGDGSEDHLVHSRNRVQDMVQSRSLILRDGTDGSVAWRDVVSVDSFFEDGGYMQLDTFETNGGTTIFGYRQPAREGNGPDERPPPTLVAFGGPNDRVEHTLENVSFIRSADLLGDVSGDGVPDALVGTPERAIVVDVQSGNVVWERRYEDTALDDTEVWRPTEGTSRFNYFSVGRNRVVTLSSEGYVGVVDGMGRGNPETQHETEIDGGIDDASVRNLGDRNRDGYDELLLPIEGDTPRYLVFSPGSGEVVTALGKPDDTTVVSTDITVDGDRRSGILATTLDSDAGTVSAYVGNQRVMRHQFEDAGFLYRRDVTQAIPAAPAGDVDGDGDEELAIVESSSTGGARVDLYDVGSEEPFDSITLEAFDDVDGETIPGLHAERLPDQTGDGNPELGVIAVVGGRTETSIAYFVIDPSEREILVSGDGMRSDFLGFEQGVGLLGPDGSIVTVDPSQGVPLDYSQEGTRIDLEWEFDTDREHVSRVYVNDRPVTLTTNQSATVRLPPGNHTVEVRATDSDGLTVHDTVEVSVDDDSSTDRMLYGATAMALVLLILPNVFRRIRR